MYKFLCLLIIIVHITYSQINQFLALSGGTYGFGAKYSLFYKLVSADLGATFNYNFDNIDSTFVITSNRFELNQHFSLNMTIINKQEYNIKIGIIDLNRLTYEDTRQSINDSIYQIGPGFIFSTKIGPTFEFIKYMNNIKLYGIQTTPLYFYPYNHNFHFRTDIQLNYYLRNFSNK